MTNDSTRDRGRPAKESEEAKNGGLALWQWALMLLAVVLMVGGVALGVFGGDSGGGGSTTALDPDLVRGLAPGGEPPGAAADGEGTLSPTVFRLGFSAFAGFAIGYALRSFLKLSLFALGFFFLMLLGLEYAQIIEVRWAAMSDRYDDATSWLGTQTESFMGFVTGQLPAAGVAMVGLVAGLKRK